MENTPDFQYSQTVIDSEGELTVYGHVNNIEAGLCPCNKTCALYNPNPDRSIAFGCSGVRREGVVPLLALSGTELERLKETILPCGLPVSSIIERAKEAHGKALKPLYI